MLVHLVAYGLFMVEFSLQISVVHYLYISLSPIEHGLCGITVVKVMLKCFYVLQVKWLKIELSRALVECKAANLRCLFCALSENKDTHITISLLLLSLLIIIRAEELETAFMELVKEDNRRSLTAKVKFRFLVHVSTYVAKS